MNYLKWSLILIIISTFVAVGSDPAFADDTDDLNKFNRLLDEINLELDDFRVSSNYDTSTPEQQEILLVEYRSIERKSNGLEYDITELKERIKLKTNLHVEHEQLEFTIKSINTSISDGDSSSNNYNLLMDDYGILLDNIYDIEEKLKKLRAKIVVVNHTEINKVIDVNPNQIELNRISDEKLQKKIQSVDPVKQIEPDGRGRIIVNDNLQQNNNPVVPIAVPVAVPQPDIPVPVIAVLQVQPDPEPQNVNQRIDEAKKKKRGGGGSDWKVKPTFGLSHNRYNQLVDDGFSFNGYTVNISDNWHTDFPKTTSLIGYENHVRMIVNAPDGLKWVSFSLGLSEIGKLAQSQVDIILNLETDYSKDVIYQITDIVHEQKLQFVNSTSTFAQIDHVYCNASSNFKDCYSFDIWFTVDAPLEHDVMSISAVDTKRRINTTFLNNGVEFIGESLLYQEPIITTEKPINVRPADKWYQSMSRSNSNFDVLIQHEKDRALSIWNGTHFGY